MPLFSHSFLSGISLEEKGVGMSMTRRVREKRRCKRASSDDVIVGAVLGSTVVVGVLGVVAMSRRPSRRAIASRWARTGHQLRRSKR